MNLEINLRKSVMVIFFVIMMMFFVGCSSADMQEDEVGSSTEIAEVEEEPQEVVSSDDLQIAQIGEMFAIDDFEITVNSFEFAEEVSDNMRTFDAEEGNGFVIFDMDVRNLGQESIMLSLSSMHDLNIRLVYDDFFRFNTITLMGFLDSIEHTTIAPLVTENGKLVFRVSDDVLTSNDSLYIEFFTEDFMSREVMQSVKIILR